MWELAEHYCDGGSISYLLSPERFARLPSHLEAMNHPADCRQTYSSSSRGARYHRWPDPAHNQATVVPNREG